jgi:hypothetical protein
MMLSPGPFGDAGWDKLSDHKQGTPKWRRYLRFSERLCTALGVPTVILHHVPLSPAQAIAARDLDAVGNVVRLMIQHDIPFVEPHWPTAGPPQCSTTGDIECGFRIEKLVAA